MTVVKGYDAAWPKCRAPSRLRCHLKSFKIFVQRIFSILIKSKYAVILNFIERGIRLTAYDIPTYDETIKSPTISQTISPFASYFSIDLMSTQILSNRCIKSTILINNVSRSDFLARGINATCEIARSNAT